MHRVWVKHGDKGMPRMGCEFVFSTMRDGCDTRVFQIFLSSWQLKM